VTQMGDVFRLSKECFVVNEEISVAGDAVSVA
jgi:hypothetical protein